MKRVYCIAVPLFLLASMAIGSAIRAEEKSGAILDRKIPKVLQAEAESKLPAADSQSTPSVHESAYSDKVEVNLSGDSGTMYVEVIEKSIELETKFGKLSVPLSDVRRVELALRVSPDAQAKIDDAIKKLGSENFNVRETATQELTEFGELAYASLQLAEKLPELEVRNRAKSLLSKVRQNWPSDYRFRSNDLVVTKDSNLTGTVLNTSIKMKTKQFGERELMLEHIKAMKSFEYLKEIEAARPASLENSQLK